MTKGFFIYLILIVTSLNVMAQVDVTGTVVDKERNEPLVGASVIVKGSDGKIKKFTSSKTDGGFTMTVPGVTGMRLEVSMMGFAKQSIPLDSVSFPLSVRMEEGSIQLKEVTFKAERIREQGDTITYHVGSFAQKQDRTIGDVLKRMPGIDVAKNGKIQYQGTDINKFYIEGNDLLGGKYGIATNGIAHDDIGSVEVMENHQPMQVLRGLSFSDQAAINLKMKNRAKATFLCHGTIGGGYSCQPKGALWQGDIFTMMVMGKYQMITTFQGNNSGTNLSGQLFDFFSDRSEEQLSGYIGLSTPSPPNLAAKRSYFNRSWMISSSHLWKTARGGEIKAQIDYNNDRVTAQGASATTYFLDSGDKVIVEDRNSLSHRNALAGKFTFEANEKSYFLNNTLKTDVSWNDLRLNTTGTLPNTQTARMPEYSVSNVLKVIKRFRGNKLVTFTSRNEWNSLPERLTVVHNGSKYGEKISQHSFYTDERASLGFIINHLMVSLETGATGYFRKLRTDLQGINNSAIIGDEALTTDYLRLFAAPKLEWSYSRMELTVNLPVNLYTYFFSGSMKNRTEVFFSPALSAKWKITPRMSLTLRGSARRSPASLHNIHDSSILTDYRSFNSGTDDYYTASGQSLGLSYTFRNSRQGTFISAMGQYSWNRSKFGSMQNIEGDYIFHSYTALPSKSRNAYGMLNIGKTLDFMRGSTNLKGNYNYSHNNMWSQGNPTSYHSEAFSITPSVNGNISTMLNWSLQFTWSKNFMQIADMPRQSSTDYIYSGTVTLTPCPLLTWTTGGEFYRNEIADGRYKNMMMLDTKLTFNIGRRIEISGSVTNILNRKSYSYTTFGTLLQTEYSSMLRGREFLITLYLKK